MPLMTTDSSDRVERIVRLMLQKLHDEDFDTLSDVIIFMADVPDEGARPLTQIIDLIVEKAMEDSPLSQTLARLCLKMAERISPNIWDGVMMDSNGNPITGSLLLRRYLHQQCHATLEKAWCLRNAATSTQRSGPEKNLPGNRVTSDLPEFHHNSVENSNSRMIWLNLVRFMGELFNLSLLSDCASHEFAMNPLTNKTGSNMPKLVFLVELLTTLGPRSDSAEAEQYLAIYLSRTLTLFENPEIVWWLTRELMDLVAFRQDYLESSTTAPEPALVSQHSVPTTERPNSLPDYSDPYHDLSNSTQIPKPFAEPNVKKVIMTPSNLNVPNTSTTGKTNMSNFPASSIPTTLLTPRAPEFIPAGMAFIRGPTSASTTIHDGVITNSSSPPTSRSPLTLLTPRAPEFIPASVGFNNGPTSASARFSNFTTNTSAKSGSLISPTLLTPRSPEFVPSGKKGIRITNASGEAVTFRPPEGVPKDQKKEARKPTPIRLESEEGRRKRLAEEKEQEEAKRRAKEERLEHEKEAEMLADEGLAKDNESISLEERQSSDDDSSIMTLSPAFIPVLPSPRPALYPLNTPNTDRFQHHSTLGLLDLSNADKTETRAPPPPTLATARAIHDLSTIHYPPGIKTPMVLNQGKTIGGKFSYDRDFLLQFMSICKDKPTSLPAFDTLGIEKGDPGSPNSSRSGSRGRAPRNNRNGVMGTMVNRPDSLGLGNLSSAKGGVSGPFHGGFGSFSTLSAVLDPAFESPSEEIIDYF